MTEPKAELTEPGAEAPHDDLADPLDPWARATAVGLGAAAIGFGCLAVFVASNQAGTAVLLVVGAVLLLLGLQGTPLRSFGGGDYRFELARLRRRAAAVVDQAARRETPEVAAAVADAVSAIDPGLAFPNWPHMVYEDQVRAAIRSVGALDETYRPGPADRGVDIRVQLPHGKVNVQVKYRKHGLLSSRDQWVAAANLLSSGFDGGHLIVANTEASNTSLSHAAATLKQVEPVEVVTWRDERDNEKLLSAMQRSAR